MSTRLLEIITLCTKAFAKEQSRDDSVLRVIVIEPAPTIAKADLDGDFQIVDVYFANVRVDMGYARAIVEELRDELKALPEPDLLAHGVGFLVLAEVARFETHEAPLRLLALGKALGFWDVTTPTTLGFSGEHAEALARDGLVCMTGFKG